MIDILRFLDSQMVTPTNYSWFHIMWLAIIAVITTLLCVFFRNSSEKVMKRILLITWIIILVLEILKQINFTFRVNGDNLDISYQWYAFPFQLCSTPLYTLPVIVFLPRTGKIKTFISDCFIAFSCFFAFFGGLAVMFYPNDVFISTAFINVQTMIHHGSQVVIGIFLMVYFRKVLDHKFYLKSLPTFGLYLLIAFILNIAIGAALGPSVSFNMFYISPMPGQSCHLPLLSMVWQNAPYPVFLLVYILGFAICAYIMFIAAFGINKLVQFLKNKKNTNESK